MLNCPTCEFADFDSDKCKRLLNRLPHVCPYAEERKPRNHFEAVKAMGVEEMSEFIEKLTKGLIVPPGCPKAGCKSEYCQKCWLDWLKEEVENA